MDIRWQRSQKFQTYGIPIIKIPSNKQAYDMEILGLTTMDLDN